MLRLLIALSLKVIGLVICRRDARAVRVISCTGLYGSKKKKAGFGVRISQVRLLCWYYGAVWYYRVELYPLALEPTLGLS